MPALAACRVWRPVNQTLKICELKVFKGDSDKCHCNSWKGSIDSHLSLSNQHWLAVDGGVGGKDKNRGKPNSEDCHHRQKTWTLALQECACDWLQQNKIAKMRFMDKRKGTCPIWLVRNWPVVRNQTGPMCESVGGEGGQKRPKSRWGGGKAQKPETRKRMIGAKRITAQPNKCNKQISCKFAFLLW